MWVATVYELFIDIIVQLTIHSPIKLQQLVVLYFDGLTA